MAKNIWKTLELKTTVILLVSLALLAAGIYFISIFTSFAIIIAAFFVIRKIIRDVKTVHSTMEKSVIEANERIMLAHKRTMLMLDTSPLSCQFWDKNQKKIDCNEVTVKLFGYKSKQEFLEKYEELFPMYQPDGSLSADKVAEHVKKAYDVGYEFFNWVYRMRDGTLMPAEITLVRTIYEDDYVIVGYTRDMREHNKMINDLEYKDNLFQAVSNAASFLMDSNPGSFDSDLYQSMEVIGKAIMVDRIYFWVNSHINRDISGEIHEWPDNKGAPGVNSSDWEEMLLNGNTINGIVSSMSEEMKNLFSPRGAISVLLMPLLKNNQVHGFVGLDDCSNERVFSGEEKTILHSGGLLFFNALHRNQMIKNIRETSIQLESALYLANAASKAKGDFLSNMSHEMRTPMNAIIGMTAIGKKADDIHEKNHALNKIGDASSHLLGVINDILDMAKIEADKLEIFPVDFHFENMLQKVLTVIHFRADEKAQNLTVNVDKKIPRFINGDDQRLSQVISNLLSNAVKFTPEGGNIAFDISFSEEFGDKFEILFAVKDSGIGISAEQQEKLFNAFEQVESGISRLYGGTGLGLSISKRIVNLLGGRIWIESELGKGAKFFFTVRVSHSKKMIDEAGELSHAKESAKLTGGGEFTGKRLLVAEDIEINREILLALLEDTGLAIECVENGQEALDRINAAPERYDIIFMDLQMPLMDGLEATRRIRRLPYRECRNLPIVAMTANVFKDDIDRCLAAGMDDHIGKPLDIDRVMDKIRKHLFPHRGKESLVSLYY